MDQVTKTAFKKVALLVALAMAACVGVYFVMGQQAAFEFLGAYLIEFSLSIDNLFVFITVFTAFRVPVDYQHRALAWGIWTAVVLRFIFIFLGVSIVEKFTWVLYIFGFILIFSGYKMFKGEDDEEEEKDVTDNMGYKLLAKFMPITKDFVGNHFVTKIDNKWHATPLLAALMVIEASDIMFAIDSVPAALSVSTNMFIVYTSNILAILGLRQLYFVLEHLQERFAYVRYGVAIILAFTGVKLAILMFHIHIPILASIGFIFSVLVGSIILSIYKTKDTTHA
ncbi:MAG: TerC/Alx family metal homeostasis membrane protein [Peptococcaceae bacterium]|nr:TerC/Alx family metal homeostasis membrane protein [Peptococcaceae bacterium]